MLFLINIYSTYYIYIPYIYGILKELSNLGYIVTYPSYRIKRPISRIEDAKAMERDLTIFKLGPPIP